MTAEARTPYTVILFDGERGFMAIRFAGVQELGALLTRLSRRELDGILRAGPRRGVNPGFILQAIDAEIRRRVADTASRLHAQRALEQAGRAEYGGNRGAKAWLRKSKLM